MPEEAKQEESSEQVKKRAIKRVGVATALALLAAVGLTIITHKPPTTAPLTQPQPQPEQTVLPAELPASAVQTTKTETEAEPVSAVTETPPERDAPPTIAPPPPPQVVNVPQAPSEAPRKVVKPAAVKPFKEAESPAKPAPAIAPLVVEKSGRPRATQELVPLRETAEKANEAAAKANEVKKPVEAQKTPAPAKPVSSTPPPPAPISQPTGAGGKGYAVQLGVFSNPTNAIQMQEKLSQHGIQSYTETKLHVGPFQNKMEAEQALAKVRSLGIGAVVVPLR